MNQTLRLALPLFAGLLLAHSPAAEKPPGTIDLFNGKDLNGWNAVLAEPSAKKEDVWTVQDGLIVCKGEPLGHLATAQSFTSFKLVVEWRWAPGGKPGNNGVLMRINGPARPLPRCLEAQLKSGDAGDVYGFHGMKLDGDPDRLKKVANHEIAGDLVGVKKLGPNENAPGEWNRYEIQLNGPNLKVWVNGKLTNEATGCEVVAGPVAIQSEGGEIHFRTIQLTPVE
jgi:hypothetical protein